jgi:hypothetical protein
VVFFFFLLSFRGWFLVSSSLCGVWQFKFVCCPQVAEYALYLTSCPDLELSFHCPWLLGACFFTLLPFFVASQWSLSQPPAVACCDGLLIISQFCRAIWLCVLLTGSGDEFCGPLPTLFQAVAYHLPTVSPSSFPAFVYWSSQGDQFLAPPLCSVVLSATLPPLLCVSFQFLIYSVCFVVVALFFGGEVSLPRELC